MAPLIGSTVHLNNGVEMPVLGLGVWQIPSGRATQQAVLFALHAGYRLIDTAKLYGNERDVGIAVKESGIPREDVFVTTKLWNSDHGYEPALRAFDESLKRLDLGYVDLYLIHWPVPRLRDETWRAMERILKEGKARAIGVSNYTVRHLEELARTASLPPAVDQIEFSPFLYSDGFLRYCKDAGIQAEAYSPLTKGTKLGHPLLRRIAAAHGRSPAQILIRWSLQHGLVVIPKSARRERIQENVRVFDFELSPEDMRALDGLQQDYHTSWNPQDAP
ncbi:MAG TPA: aldo/keto reductase [Thermoplasmata archaeon]|nr:aldo/keto reductase [Thermoplasmata archaeon]